MEASSPNNTSAHIVQSSRMHCRACIWKQVHPFVVDEVQCFQSAVQTEDLLFQFYCGEFIPVLKGKYLYMRASSKWSIQRALRSFFCLQGS